MVSRACNTRFLEIFESEEIFSMLAQHAFGCPCKECQNLNAGWAYVKICSALSQCAMKLFPRMLSKRWNRYLVRSASACFPKNLIKIQFSTKSNRNFEKPSRIPSNRNQSEHLVKILDTSQPNIGSAYAQSLRKCSNIEIMAKNERKESNGHPTVSLTRIDSLYSLFREGETSVYLCTNVY